MDAYQRCLSVKKKKVLSDFSDQKSSFGQALIIFTADFLTCHSTAHIYPSQKGPHSFY